MYNAFLYSVYNEALPTWPDPPKQILMPTGYQPYTYTADEAPVIDHLFGTPGGVNDLFERFCRALQAHLLVRSSAYASAVTEFDDRLTYELPAAVDLIRDSGIPPLSSVMSDIDQQFDLTRILAGQAAEYAAAKSVVDRHAMFFRHLGRRAWL